MSLRRRLLLVVVLAAIALGAAALAILHVATSTDAARLRAVETTLAATADALVEAFGASHAPNLGAADGAHLEAQTRAIVAHMTDTSAGFCALDGRVVAQAGTGRRGEPVRPPPLPPDQRDALVSACRGATGRDTRTTRLTHPHDIVVIAVRQVASDGSAWVLARVPVPSPEGEVRWKLDLALLSTATVLLVAVTLSAVIALGGGFRDLEASLGALRGDLRAPLPRPRAHEFARLSAGLSEMAEHLAEARARENGLMRDLSHRDRLSALGRVVAGVAHEIRNPLAGIKLKLDVLERSKDVASPVRDNVRSCLDEIGRLDRVVRSLLVVARKTERHDAAVGLGALVDERAHLLENAAAARSVTIRREGDVTVIGDRDELARAVDNLLRNAVEASPPNEEVCVRMTATDAKAELSIVDRGEGVAPDREAELFEPFFTSKADGTGLGLWLSRSLVEAHGGTLDYERTGGETVFRVTLPRVSKA